MKRVYLIITVELKDQNFIKEIRLQIIIKIVNDTTEYNNLVSTLLVFETYFHIINDDASSLFIIEKVKIIKITMNEIVKLHVKKQTINVLHQRNGSQIMKIHDISIDSSILIWKTHQKKWTELYKLLTVSQKTKTCTIELPNNFIEFRIIIVKSYLKESNSFIQDSIQDLIQDFIQDFIQNSIQDSIQDFIQDSIQSKNLIQSLKDNTSRRNSSRLRQRLIRFQNNITDITIYISRFISPSANFQTFRLKKLNELLEKRVFKIIYIDDLFIKTRVFENRFMNQMKNEETEKAFEKSRFIIQTFNDSEKQKILTQTPIIQRINQRLIIALSLTIS